MRCGYANTEACRHAGMTQPVEADAGSCTPNLHQTQSMGEAVWQMIAALKPGSRERHTSEQFTPLWESSKQLASMCLEVNGSIQDWESFPARLSTKLNPRHVSNINRAVSYRIASSHKALVRAAPLLGCALCHAVRHGAAISIPLAPAFRLHAEAEHQTG